ncbi:nucleotide disphospho-sugar-binding domain-containing protein [Amycolatopsis sp. H20-H5]|uniref:nucleotide disphospho-sugar-binding domain-containing protein n=1 Tax=Amycolatopsis sp. H20-H5 TaxID=3046309 RepID=UPI002DBE39C8|nr:nucleotide disphospho-sugar-binding domain-containing protein [Amycolatopsis sp. H20-H5]MEC3975003.1 nucleotide disphospho-sugar-binding domain-containing protein [Amycolatopsis sp. H20-H5]
MIPLAWALRAAGHEVLVATAGAALVAARAGLPVVDVAPGFDMGAQFDKMRREQPELVAEMLAARLTDLRAVIPQFARIADLLVDGVVQAAEQWQPDVIVQSTTQGSGLVAASKLGIPLVDHGFGLARSGDVHDLLRENMGAAFARHGVDTLPGRTAHIDVAPPSLLTERPTGWSMRYVPYGGGTVLPPWLLRERGGRPRIAVTLGTVAPSTTGLGPVERIIDAAGGIDADFVIALGDADTSGLGTLPPNVQVAGWIPLPALLRVSSALVHHGGSGSTLGALVAGLPQLVLPSGADRHINGNAVHNTGAGICAEEEELDARLLEHLLGEEKLRSRAREVSAEIAALPSPARIVDDITALTR